MKNYFALAAIATMLLSGCEQKRPVAETPETAQPTDTTALSDTTTSGTGQISGQLSKVIGFTGAQVTGISAASNGRLFVNFPRWRDYIPFSVAEIMPDGSVKPFPDSTWNTWTGRPKANRFTCVQSVIAHGNSLFVLDPANPQFKGVVGNAMLYEFDLGTNQLRNKWTFDKTVAPAKSYLNDLRIDDKNKRIYITDSGLGAIVVLDPQTGKAKRLLANHAAVKSENITLTIDGKEWLQNGKRPQINSDGIALSPDMDYLYFHALTGYTLYRVPTKVLANGTDDEAAKQVENLGKTPAPDGMIFDKNGNLFMADLEKNAIVYRTPTGEIKTLIQDPKLKWPDTFTFDRQGNLLVTASHIHEATGDISDLDFEVFKITIKR